jgi:hypothetical protein
MRFRKFTLTLLLACVALLSVAQIEQVTENQAGISRRLQHEIDATKDPSLGYVPKSRLVKAYQARQARLNQLGQLNRAPLFSWTERGPTSDVTGPSNGNTRPGNGKTSGRVRAIFEDLGDATGKTVWVGGIDGGLWKTADITANPATWTPINDFFGNLAVASICQDPTDVNIMYFGTGEKSVNADAVRGAGIWRSTDHGVTWDLMPGSAALWNVSKVVCDAAGNLYVGCNSISNTQGLQRYTKATGTWTNITPTGLATRIPDIELSTTGRLHIVCGYYNSTAATSGYRYTDNPATVTAGSWTSPATSFSPVQYNVELATSGNTVYALPSNSSFQVTTIYKSTDGGANWVVTGTTPSFTSGQAWYCLAVAVDPNNADNVIVGSLDCYKTTNGGGTWTKISEWVGTTGQYVHADQQIITWSSNNQVLFGCDGGVHYSANGGTTISDRNAGLRIKQFYAVAHHPTSTNYFLAGAQDNGVHQLNNTGIGASVEVTGGDGAFVHIDQNEPQYQWGSYVYNQYRRSTNGGSTWTSVNYSSTAGKFINPTDYDDAANIMYCSGAANAFVRWSNPQTGSTFTSVTMSGLNGGKVSAVKVSPYSSNTVFFGGGGSGISPSLIKSTNADATPVFTSIIGAGMTTASSNISSIELGSDEQNIIVAYSNYGVNNVFVTTNGGASWSAVDGNLPDMPVRWAMFYPGSNTKAIIATETGIWQTEVINGAATVWDPEAGFPNVRVDMMQYRESDGLLSAATHGRGLFTTIIGAAPSCGTVAGLASSSVTTNSATVSWTSLSGAISYDVDYKLASSGTWTNAATATTNASAALGGLSSGSLYEYRVRANCAGATGAYVQAQFTTSSPATCGTVTGLASSAVTANSATVSWTALSGALNYDLDYKLASSGTWINAVTATTSLSRALTGLATGSTYDYRVRANCSGATGAYAQAQFTTTAAPTCPGIYDVSSNGSASGAATIPFNTDVKGLISSATDNDYYKFVVTTGGTATITLTTLSADFDIAVYSSDGTTRLARSQNNGTTSETITRTYTAGTYYVRVYGYNGASNATNCYTLKVQLGTATLQELPEMASENLTVKLFPNPAKDKVSVYLLGDNTRKNLIVYDVTGRAIYSQGLNEMFTTLDLQKLLKGVYVVKITALNGKVLYAEKIVKE